MDFNSSATFLPNLVSLVHMVQEILDKMGQNIKNTKVLLVCGTVLVLLGISHLCAPRTPCTN